MVSFNLGVLLVRYDLVFAASNKKSSYTLGMLVAVSCCWLLLVAVGCFWLQLAADVMIRLLLCWTAVLRTTQRACHAMFKRKVDLCWHFGYETLRFPQFRSVHEAGRRNKALVGVSSGCIFLILTVAEGLVLDCNFYVQPKPERSSF
jgi:hypothetical protein